MSQRWNFSDQFKAKIVLAALCGDKTIHEIAAKHQIHSNRVSMWKRQAIEAMSDMPA